MRLTKLLLALCLACSLVTSRYISRLENTVKSQRQAIDQLSTDYNEAQAELADIKHQQELNNAVTEDLSSRLAGVQGWKQRR